MIAFSSPPLEGVSTRRTGQVLSRMEADSVVSGGAPPRQRQLRGLVIVFDLGQPSSLAKGPSRLRHRECGALEHSSCCDEGRALRGRPVTSLWAVGGAFANNYSQQLLARSGVVVCGARCGGRAVQEVESGGVGFRNIGAQRVLWTTMARALIIKPVHARAAHGARN